MYKEMGSGSNQTQFFPGGSTTWVVIQDLKPVTSYSIQVAAANSFGTGVYSEPVTCITRPGKN